MDYNNNDSQYIEEAKDLVINSIGETMDLYGINRSVGNLYGIMVFEGSMTLDEMRQQLQMSKPSMSTGVKKLIEDAENIIHPLLEKNDIDEEVKKQAINVKAQLDHSKIYYKWLAQLSEALESGEIFNYFPIPDEQHHHDQ